MKLNIVRTAIVFASTAVILGALNAHYLKQFFTEELTASFATGVRYQMWHALALLAVGSLAKHLSLKDARILNLLFTIGIIAFSGSIYILCAFKSNGIIGLTGLGILTPIGGLLLVVAWIFFFLKLNKKPSAS